MGLSLKQPNFEETRNQERAVPCAIHDANSMKVALDSGNVSIGQELDLDLERTLALLSRNKVHLLWDTNHFTAPHGRPRWPCRSDLSGQLSGIIA